MTNKLRLIKKYTGFLFLAAIIFSCAGSPKEENRPLPPLWVTDTEKVYPDRDWLVVVEAEQDAKLAERAAITRLTQTFRVDLVSVTNANRQLAETISSVKGKTRVITSQSNDIAQELVSTSVVSELIGLQVESWANSQGRSYANARMNRKECSARYSAMIRENEKVIDRLFEEAERNPRTFEAFQTLNLAYSFAQVTDNFHSLLTVLDPSAISKRPSYGNAEAVKSLAQNAGRSIVVTVKVNGDNSGRIEKAFTECLNSRGFRTSSAGDNFYVLAGSFQLEDVDIVNPNNYKYARYVLNYSLKNKDGAELLSSSNNGREGHLTVSEARQRALRAAEQNIASTGFAVNFDAFFASLL
jgi:predicted nucleic acid-binding protein